MPAKVLLRDRAIVIAGFANEVDSVHGIRPRVRGCLEQGQLEHGVRQKCRSDSRPAHSLRQSGGADELAALATLRNQPGALKVLQVERSGGG
jgi:hypothetical protein